jgi:type IV pilus assembly protein PilB
MARLGELLVQQNVISPSQLVQAQDEQKKEGGRLGAALTKLGFVQEKDLIGFLAKQYKVPAINLAEYEIDTEVIKTVPQDVAEKHMLVPLNRAGSSLIVAMADPSNIFAIDDVKFLTGFNIEVVVASEGHIKAAIEKYYTKGGEQMNYDSVMEGLDEGEIDFAAEEADMNVVDLEKSAEDAPVVKLVNLILVDAMKKNASDIHIEPYEKEFRVRYRIDGMLYEMMKPPMKLRNALISRVKIMSNLDISERRLPQDGRIKLKLGKGKEMDYRVSVLPTLFGEKIVLRLLDKGNLQLDMTKLGFEQAQLDTFLHGIHKPYGMSLVTGPTGSGKTTTLYSALADLNKIEKNISTAEDPVEFNLTGINQVQMHEDIGLNFAAALRSFLRQDPNIIMVGEIRDFETAEIAIKASLTGHMVLSTLHTNDAPATVSRMLNMGIEPFLICASLNVILAQRLARRICNECKALIDIPAERLLEVQVPKAEVGKFKTYKGKGCANCSNTGYKGRIALYEVMEFAEPLKEVVLSGGSTAELKMAAMKNGMQTLRMSAVKKLMEGTTTVEEVVRVSVSDEVRA